MNDTSSKTTALVRRTFLDFFASRDHQVVASAPLVPQADPTLMFVNAGMVQFKDTFTGRESRDYSRACSSQKCIRISGKHNDLENVGATARHHTFFEMLGNFSFGDYFKEEAIRLSWELLTKVYEIPAERMVVTVFEGSDEFAPDDEAAELWTKVAGVPPERVFRMGMADNFWSMGDTGPCGPCSEIHYFHGDGLDLGSFGQEPAADGRGWTEIWNLVFMQYDRAAAGAPATPLPAPSIDTGAGLERLAGVIQGVTSNYDTDVLRRLVERVARIADKPYRGTSDDDDVSMRVVADHARTTAFLIAEGVLPDKQRREYVLRRVMRRAIRHGHRLGIDQPFLHEVAQEVIDAMGEDYPELGERAELIHQVTEGEEVRFRQTLRRGMKILDERFETLRSSGEQRLSAEIAADLYTTYGFPLDLTEVIAAEQGLAVDGAGATAIIRGAEEADGPIDPGAAIDPVYRAVADDVGATRFIGYERERCGSIIAALIRLGGEAEQPSRERVTEVEAGADVEIVVAETPFYAEAGGQVGDVGTIRSAAESGEAGRARVLDTQRPVGQLTVHRARVEAGALRVGDEVELEVDHEARAATRRNHSATHLLHWALRTVLGEHAQQKGSRVAADMLRFDFTQNQPVTREQIERIEDLVNAKILSNAPVVTEVLGIDEARARGAVAIFEEKYGDTVRMLTMTEDSKELCGGTHTRALGEIGLFVITSEGGTAAGVRRVFAATGSNAVAVVRGLHHDLARASSAAKAQGGDLADKITKLVGREKQLEKRVAELERQLLEAGSSGGGGLDAVLAEARSVGDVRVVAHRAPDDTKIASLRELCEKIRDKLGGESVVLVGSAADGKAQLALTVSKAATGKLNASKLIRPVAAKVGGSGGGRPDMAQAGGSDPAGLDEALTALYGEVEQALAG
ncbi:MAG: alanine--tRNA ligase [Deltaproteobacteria bacterium]|jgi:alanyl-tRNA synthetase|nr:alanine--tRNA ligase [Deltaproteobacteria bacterium]MBW2536265.1 alanine--tRNA ligase [Deltaproteobacteria bacterium]